MGISRGWHIAKLRRHSVLDHRFALEGGTVMPTQTVDRQVVETGFRVFFATVHGKGGPSRTVPLKP